MNDCVDIQALTRCADIVICSIVMNLERVECELLEHTEAVAKTDNDLLLDRLFASQVLILESITKLKIASELLNLDRCLDSACATGNPSVPSR